MSTVIVERLSSPQIRAIQELIYATSHTNVAFAHLLRYCLFAHTLAFVAKMDSQIVGFIGGVESGPICMIEYLCVDLGHRNLGTATVLINAFLNEASASNYCELDVRLSNTIARQFYVRRGFREVSRKARYYADEDALTMVRSSGIVLAPPTAVP